MAPPSPIAVFLCVGSFVFVVGGALTTYRWSVTIYHIPILVLVLFAVTVGLTGYVGAVVIDLTTGNVGYGSVGDIVVFLGTFSAVVLAVVSAFGWVLSPFKLPTAILGGLGSIAGLAVSGVTELGLLTGVPVLTIILIWVGLTVVEQSMDESYRERMKS